MARQIMSKVKFCFTGINPSFHDNDGIEVIHCLIKNI